MASGSRILERLREPRDGAGLAAFRFLFGMLCLFSIVRFGLKGWVELYFVKPELFFKFWGLEAVEAWPRPWLYVHLAAVGVFATSLAVGFRPRLSAALFFVGFSYLELIDVTNYLNHYYLVSLLSLLLAFMPAGRVWSVDAWLARRSGAARSWQVPAWTYVLLRFQVGIVYIYAGLAKATGDWLLHAQPLNLWLNARSDFPLIGPVFEEPITAFVFSWLGFLHDLLIVPALLWRRSRRLAYAALVTFHVLTGLLLPIGLFPIIMMVGATVFFAADWPRRLPFCKPLGRTTEDAAPPVSSAASKALSPLARAGFALAAGYCLFQLFFPLRTHLYGGNVLWHEQGMRWSWRVVVREKNGDVVYRVRVRERGRIRDLRVTPRRYLTGLQEREMSGQPDLILQLAQHIAHEHEAQRKLPVEVYADAFVSLNGRRPTRLIDPNIDLSQVRDGLAPARWVLPAPTAPPPLLERRSAD